MDLDEGTLYLLVLPASIAPRYTVTHSYDGHFNTLKPAIVDKPISIAPACKFIIEVFYTSTRKEKSLEINVIFINNYFQITRCDI